MNKAFKIILGVVTVIGILIIIGAVIIFNSLPSVSSIASSLKHKKIEAPALQAQTLKTSVASGDTAVSAEDEKAKEKSRINQLILGDLMSKETPLSNFCKSLKNAKIGSMSGKEFGEAMILSVGEETKDPRIQAAKPMLRYVMRLPMMTELIEAADAAAERNEEGFFKKAEFYAKAVSAFTEMKDHKTDIESVMDRSYLLFGLDKLIVKKPELLQDSRVQNYCDGVERAFNQSNPVDFENEKKDFLRFLDEVNVKPKDIDFDVNYKSELKFNFSKQSMTFEGGWLSDLVQTDPKAVQ